MLERLKRWLEPLRPVLLPIWRPVRPYIVRSSKLPSRRSAVTRPIGAARRRVEARLGRIRPVNEAEFADLAKRYPYYRNRWEYTAAAGREAADLIKRHRLRRALELGPHVRPLVVGADVMVLERSEELDAEGAVIVHDARMVPWPIADRGYDLFVALQVFEHLIDRQREAFAEVCRVARHAIISLPIDWQMDDPGDCHHGISEERALSWFAPRVPTRVVEGNAGPRRRVIYVFENLDTTP